MEVTIIKEIRNLLQITQEQMTRELNISFCTINRWENAHTRPSHLAPKAIIEPCIKNKVDSKFVLLLDGL